NYIGITEPPKVMFRKIMGISDTLMWRYWELLTDLSLDEIAALKQCEPMAVTIDLARRIVADFHSANDARQAEEDFTPGVRQGEEPADIPKTAIAAGKLAQALVSSSLAPSRTEAERLIKAGAVEINGERCTNPSFAFAPGEYTVRAGKKWARFIVK